MSASLAVERVRAALREKGVDTEIMEFAQSTRTAQEAADAIGTSVAQIVKSLVFVAGGQPFLALVSGAQSSGYRQALGAHGRARRTRRRPHRARSDGFCHRGRAARGPRQVARDLHR